MHGSPREAAGFAHFLYVNPDAPKGGRVTFSKQGSYDSLNPLIVKGEPADGVRDYVYESLLARANDEPFTLYGLIAASVETPPDRSFVEFTLNPAAKFSDGVPITVDDVIFSHALLRDHGRPNHRSYYKKVVKVEQTGERKVRFTFDQSGDREMPLIMGLMPVCRNTSSTPTSSRRRHSTPSSAAAPTPLPRSTPANRSPSSAIPTIGDAISRSIAGSIISMKSATTIIATQARCSRRSSRAWCSFATRTTRRAGRRPTTFPQRATDASSRRSCRSTSGRNVGARLQHAAPVVRRPARARGADQAVRFRMGEPNALSRPIRAERKLLRRARIYPRMVTRPTRPSGRCSRLFSIGEARDHGRELRSSGERRHRREPGGASRGAQLLEQAGYQLRTAACQCGNRRAFPFEIIAATRDQERLLLTYAAALKHRNRGASPSGRFSAISAAQADLRFRHDPVFWPVSLRPETSSRSGGAARLRY